MLANVLQVTGLLAIAVGVGWIFLPAGVVALGVGALLFGLALERE
jgi:hypothetical protein